MARSQETFNKKEIRNKKEKKRKEKEKKRLERKEKTSSSFDDMIAYVDENGNITDTPQDPKNKTVIELEDIEISVSKREDIDDPIHRGKVSFFNESKGYGFIRDSETRENIFVHVNNVLEEIKEGNMVNFEIEKGPKGYIAVNVKVSK